MASSDPGETNRILLGRASDPSDGSACRRFDATYRPLIRDWGRRLGVRGDDLEELCQVAMIEVMSKLKTFRYDPMKSFRGWIKQIVRWRAGQLLRGRRRRALPLLDAEGVIDPRLRAELVTTRNPGDDPIMGIFEEIQESVRRRVDPENWQIFWMIRVEGRPIAEVARAVDKTYAATYRNQQRIARMLRDEAGRRLEP